MKAKETSSSQKTLYVVVAVLVVISVFFRFLNDYKLEQKSILFIGLPALLTLFMIKYSPKQTNLYGIVFKTITIFLLMSGILFGEGILCIIISAPLFYGIAAIIIALYNYFKKRNKPKLYSFIAIPFLLLIAQPLEIFEEPKIHTVETTLTVPNTVNFNDFNKHPDFMENLPDIFKVGFPKPIAISGEGIEVGDTRTIQFKSMTKGIGELTLKIIEKNDERIVFQPIQDKTHIHHWLHWEKVTVEIMHSTSNETNVKWTSQYKCVLGPAWYFQPMEHAAVDLMNQHLIHAYFN